MRNLWRKYSFLGAETQLNHSHKIQVVISNQLSINIVLTIAFLFPLFVLYDYPIITTTSLLLPLVMSIAVPILNFKNKKRVSEVIICLIIPVSAIVSNTCMKVIAPLDNISEGDYFRSHLWFIISLIIPFLVIDSSRKFLFLTMLILPFMAIFFTDHIYKIWGVSYQDAGFDPKNLVLYNIISTLIGLFVVIGLSFMNNLNKYYRGKVQAMQEKLYESEKMASLGVLTTGISHEINNPLNFIRGGLEIIRKEMSGNKALQSNELSHSLGLIDEGTTRVSKIVKSLQYFGEPLTGNFELLNLLEIVNGSVKQIAENSDDRINIELRVSNDEMLISGNRGQLHHAFFNVLKNATQAIEGEGAIVITSEVSPQAYTIQIADNGVGISEKDLPRVMEPLFTTRNPGEGFGMGLSIAYNIVKWHYGTMTLESEKAVGTKVIIAFSRHGKLV